MKIIKTKTRLGFTLIEILVVTGILATVGLIASSIFFSTLKGAAKTEILKEVKQNGDFAISTMGGMIRNAREISVCSGSSESSIQIVNPDNGTTNFLCDLGFEQIASNSSLLISDKFLTSDKLAISDCSFTCISQSKGQKQVNIQFTLSQKGSPARPEDKASLTFETTVYTRSYSY
ncbi:type II secretion system protein [Candidatus Microgenomates bacterium]|nr:type II secretion system protein [Candidatus Microgenomates bacterium]